MKDRLYVNRNEECTKLLLDMENTSTVNTQTGPATVKSEFQTKVKALDDLRTRLKENQQNVETVKEVITSLKHFETTLLRWIKDSQPCFNVEKRDFDRDKFPALPYESLFNVLLNFISNNVNFENNEVTNALVSTLASTFPFLSHETFMSLPTTLADALYDIPRVFQHKLIDLLCQYIVPLIYTNMTENIDDEMEDINLCVPSVLASVLDATADAGSWTKIMECFMQFKRTVSSDLLSVLAYGTVNSLDASTHLLNRYFPPVDMASKKTYQSAPYENIQPFKCQHPNCKADSKNATMKCLDPSICADLINAVPPMYMCDKCYSSVDMENTLFIYVVQPADLVSQICDNPDCRFGFMKAVYFCYSLDCVKKNDNKPIRLCDDCHNRLHMGSNNHHMSHQCLKELWVTENPEQTYLVDAMIRLWAEAQPNFQEKCNKMGLTVDVEIREKSKQDSSYFRKVFRSLNGLMLLNTTCPIPSTNFHSNLHYEHLGRLLAMLFVWVESAEYTSHPQALETVKPNIKKATEWINKVCQFDLTLYCSCLLPNPPKHVRVGHPWNMLTSVARKDMEILQRIVTLSKKGLVPEQVWNTIMPEWIQEIQTIPTNEIKQFKKILGELFDMNSEGKPEFALNFIKKNLESTILRQSQEGLVWVQILSYLDVKMEITSLLNMFIEMMINKGESLSNVEHTISSVFPFPDKQTLHKVTSTGTPTRRNSVHSFAATSPHNAQLPVMKNVHDDLSITVLILDVLIKQLTLQKSSIGNIYIADKEKTSLNVLLVCILDQPLEDQHIRNVELQCPKCLVMNTVYYMTGLLIDLAVQKPVTSDPFKASYTKSINRRRNSSSASKMSRVSDKLSSIKEPEFNPEEGSSKGINRSRSSTKKYNFDPDEDLQSQISKKDSMPHLSTLPPHISKEQVLQMQRRNIRSEISESVLNVIPELLILEKLFQELSDSHEALVALHILNSLETLCICGECLRMVANENLELLNKLLTNLIIPSLWSLLESTNSNMAICIVTLLLHCANLPFGAEQLCEEMEFYFTREDWKVRFAGVDKIGLLCQFIAKENFEEGGHAQSVVVHGVCYLTTAVEDVNVAVSIRARTVIRSIKISSLKLIYQYMECHFFNQPGDRMLLLNAFRTIHLVIPEASCFNGQFFYKLLNILNFIDVDNKTGEQVESPSTFSNRDSFFEGTKILSIYNRNLHGNKKTFGYNMGQVPMNVYRNKFTLQSGKTWKYVNSGKSVFTNFKHVSNDMMGAEVAGLGTLTEEDEGRELCKSRQSIHSADTVLSDGGSGDDEMMSFLIYTLFEFLSTHETGEKMYKENTDDNQLKLIISYFGLAMGFQPLDANDWEVSKVMSSKKLRKNPIFVAYMMNLPRLLDQNIRWGNSFMNLTLIVMETCVKDRQVEEHKTLCLNRLEPALLRVWLSSLIVIVYKYKIAESPQHQHKVWQLLVVVKNTLAGHGHHFCCDTLQSKRSFSSFRHIANVRMNIKTYKKKKSSAANAADQVVNGTGTTAIEMSDFASGGGGPSSSGNTGASLDTSILESEGADPRYSRISEMYVSPDTTEDLVAETKQRICEKCRLVLFDYEDEAVNYCIIALLTYIDADTEQAASFLIEVIQSVALEASVFSSANSKVPELGLTLTASIAQQFLRCVFYKLAPSRLFPELFSTDIQNKDFFIVMAVVLQDFQLMSQLEPIKSTLYDPVSIEAHSIVQTLQNLTIYMKHMINNPANQWSSVRSTLQNFFENVPSNIPRNSDMDCLLQMMSLLLEFQKNTAKVMIEEMDTTMTHVVKNCQYTVKSLCSLTNACCGAFLKDRDQLRLTRKITFLFASALSGKSSLSERSLSNIIQFFLNDVGTKFEFDDFPASSEGYHLNTTKLNRVAECVDTNYASEVIEYVKAPCRRIKDSGNSHDHEKSEQFPSQLKLALSQFIAVYVSPMKSPDESRLFSKVHAVLCSDQSQDRSHIQATNMDLPDYIAHFGMYSWIILGAINHSVVKDVPITIFHNYLHKAAAISEYIEIVFKNIVKEHSEDLLKKGKTKAQLQLSFLLMQIWNVYVEQHYTLSQAHHDVDPIVVIKKFWSKLTPVFYSLLQRSTKLQEECIQQFAQLVENISVHCPRTFSQLFSLWSPFLEIYGNHINSAVMNKIRDIGSVKKNNVNSPTLSQWVSEMHKKLWNTERMLKGKLTPSGTV